MYLGLCFFLATCQAPETRAPHDMPTYRQLVTRYNQNIESLTRLWARVDLELRWREQKKRHFESGSGHLVIMVPSQLALSVGKGIIGGETKLWIGCNEQHYWLLDLQQPRVAYVGRHEQFDQSESQLPVRPIDFPQLLGLVRIEPVSEGKVTWQAGQYVIELPTGVRMSFGPESAMPTQIELPVPPNDPPVVSHLSRPQRVRRSGGSLGSGPRIATRIEIRVGDNDANLTLFLSNLTDNEDKFAPEVFEFEHLRNQFRIHEVKNLNRRR